MSTQEFDLLLAPYIKIKDERVVNTKLKFYEDRVDQKRLPAERAKVTILALSLVIPIVANLKLPDLVLLNAQVSPGGLIVAVLSLSIAFLTSLNEVYQWQHLWRAYSQAIVQIESLLGLWELKVAHARQLSNPREINDTLEQATETLLKSVDQIVSTEMGTFFTATQHTPETQGTQEP